MMMETVVYSREYLFVKELYDKGELGRHPVPARQPPAGHGRLARLLARPAADVVRHPLRQPVPGASCRQGTGRERRLPRLRPHPRGADRRSTAARSPSRRPRSRSRTRDVVRRGDPQPVRHGPAVPRELRRHRQQEAASSGSRSRARSRSSTPSAGACPSREIPQRVKVPDFAHLLPEPIRRFTSRRRSRTPTHLSFLQGGGHGGSHPHLVHNFLMAVLGRAARLARRRRPAPTGRWSASAPTSRR